MKKNKKLKLLCPSPEAFSKSIKKELSKKFNCNFSKMNNSKFDKICHKYEIILIRFNNALKYKSETKIRYILCPSTATEHIDNQFFTNKKIKIFSLKNHTKFLQNIRASIEFTIYLILNYLRRNKIGSEIFEKNVGIIGFGRIGKKVYKILKSFNANLKIFEKKKISRSPKSNFVTLKKLLTTSQIILIHIPLNRKNENFLDSSKLRLIKRDSVVINTSRGNVLDESFIFSLVERKKISYFTDVISEKVLKGKRNIIKKLKNNSNFHYSGHVAGLTRESIEKTDLFVYKNFLKYFLN